LKAVVESSGVVGSCARLGTHELRFDQPASVPGGEDRAPSPLDVMVVAVAACAHYFASAFLHARGLSTEGLRVEVESEKASAPVPRLARLALTVHLPAGLPARHVAAIRRAIERCPAYGTLLHPPAVEIRYPDERAAGGRST
jgi:uncharacterized OsmC-like protein